MAPGNKINKIPSSGSMGALELIEAGSFFGCTKLEWTAGLPIYCGRNVDPLASDGATNWQITKFTWDGSDPTVIQVQNGTWTGRAALTWT